MAKRKFRTVPSYKPVPIFIKHYSAGLPQRQIDEARKHLSNWLKLHAYLGTLPREVNWYSVQIVAKLMEFEYQRRGGPRMDIITRLYGRFSTLRYEVERVALGTRITR